MSSTSSSVSLSHAESCICSRILLRLVEGVVRESASIHRLLDLVSSSTHERILLLASVAFHEGVAAGGSAIERRTITRLILLTLLGEWITTITCVVVILAELIVCLLIIICERRLIIANVAAKCEGIPWLLLLRVLRLLHLLTTTATIEIIVVLLLWLVHLAKSIVEELCLRVAGIECRGS